MKSDFTLNYYNAITIVANRVKKCVLLDKFIFNEKLNKIWQNLYEMFIQLVVCIPFLKSQLNHAHYYKIKKLIIVSDCFSCQDCILFHTQKVQEPGLHKRDLFYVKKVR